MARRRSRLRRIANKLQTPSIKKIAAELRSGGEFGRAIPGGDQAEIRRGVAIGITEGDPAIPPTKGRTEISSYFTKPTGRSLLYQAESWVRLRHILETAGPVSVGSRDDVLPVLSGKGILLPINVEITFPVQKGNRIFIASTSINRVRYIIEPIPWDEQIALMLGSILSIARRWKGQ